MKSKKTITVIIIELIIAVLFIIGINENNRNISIIYYSYFADVAIPFAFYFLLILNESKYSFLKKWEIKATIIFALCSASEILQYFGIYAFAIIYDPNDFLMYGVGVILAVIVDKMILSKVLKFWSLE